MLLSLRKLALLVSLLYFHAFLYTAGNLKKTISHSFLDLQAGKVSLYQMTTG